MPIFSDKKEDKTTAPLLAAAALGSLPAATAVNYGLEAMNDLDSVPKGYSGKITSEMQDALGSSILGKKLYSNLPVLTSYDTPSNSFTVFSGDKSTLSPSRDQLLQAIQQGGYEDASGRKIPASQLIKKLRQSGSAIRLNKNTADILDLAHELGHAATHHSASPLNSGIIGTLHRMGRNPLGMAIAGSMGSLAMDPESEYSYLPAAVVAASQAPVLADEAVASINAMRGLKSIRDAQALPKGALSYARNKYLRNLGTYGSVAAAATAMPLLLRSAKRNYLDPGMVDESSDSSNSSMSPLKAALIAGGTGLAGLALGGRKFIGEAVENIGRPRISQKQIADMVEDRIAMGADIDKAVSKAKKNIGKSKSNNYRDRTDNT